MKKVLIVDDSIAVARQLEKIVISTGEFETVGHAKNGAEAIKMKQLSKPDLVCMDMNMPVMDGLTALRTMMAMDPNAKVVMVTSLGGVGDKFAEAIRLGAKTVLSKPLDADGVLTALREL